MNAVLIESRQLWCCARFFQGQPSSAVVWRFSEGHDVPECGLKGWGTIVLTIRIDASSTAVTGKTPSLKERRSEGLPQPRNNENHDILGTIGSRKDA